MKETASSARRFSDVIPVLRTSVWPFLAIGFLVCGFALARNLQAQVPKPTEYEVEAAYLSNFGRFVEWPARPGAAQPGQPVDEPFKVCVLGQDPFGALLDAALKGEIIGGAPLVPKRLSVPEEALSCRILFISSSRDTELNAILRVLETSDVLTVSDMARFTSRGGMIQFILDGNRVRFEINIAAARRARLSLSSQLLKVAVAVRRSP